MKSILKAIAILFWLFVFGWIISLHFIRPSLVENYEQDRGRSNQWIKVRADHLQEEPTCAVCNSKEKLVVHHILPFHLYLELELDQDNLITLCQHDHLVWGHLLNYKSYNPQIREQIKKYKKMIDKRPMNKSDKEYFQKEFD